MGRNLPCGLAGRYKKFFYIYIYKVIVIDRYIYIVIVIKTCGIGPGIDKLIIGVEDPTQKQAHMCVMFWY